MLKHSQIAALVGLSAAFWVIATGYIHLLPTAFSSPLQGSVGFGTTLPIAWLSVLLTRLVGKLTKGQLLSGVTVVGALAMMIDAVALRWFPDLYGTDEATLRLAAAWLLWGYGVSFAIALFMSRQAVEKH